MPAYYAHYRFGNKMIDELPNGIKNIILDNRELFDIGVHGPDIFFYHKPLSYNKVVKYGNQMHHEKGSDFFKKARINYAKYQDNKEAMMAYILGFVAHYCLDSIDHPYIAKKIEVSNVSHFAIESEYDRHLMAMDGVNEYAIHIVPSEYNAMIIQRFFPIFDQKIILSTIKGTKFYNNLTFAFNPIKAKTLKGLLTITNINHIKDHVLVKDKNPKCFDSDLRLDKLEVKASALYKELALNIFAYLNGQGDLDERFNDTFDDTVNIGHIKVFEDLEMEKEYEV